MQLTKYEHACFVIEKDGKSVVVDPGVLTTDFVMPDNVVAVIVTHEHPDHLGMDHLTEIANEHPSVVFIGPADVTKQLKSFETRTAHAGDNLIIEGIELEFFGENHEPVHKSRPVAQNIGVMIDERVYYPGDSYTIPEKSVDTLALPIGGPWLRIGDAIDFMLAVSPRFAFPTHDAVLSGDGQGFSDGNVASFAKDAGIEFRRIDGETIDID